MTKGNWWDKLGEPQYGGEIKIRASRNLENFDPYYNEGLTSIYGGWLEKLLAPDWTIDPAVWDFNMPWHPAKYMKGLLAESWEFPDRSTHVVHLRKGIPWQNKPPANGREFTADDVVFHYERLYGVNANGRVRPLIGEPNFQNLLSVAAVDKYTVVFKWKVSNPDYIMEVLHGPMQRQCLENPDAVKKWGDVADWRHAIGTGPFFLQDFTSGASATLVKNHDYWGHDERHPLNKLPYADSIKFIIEPDLDEALEAMRAGKLDLISAGVSHEQAVAMQKTNPEIQWIPVTTKQALTIQPRNDKPPFNDIRVRKAMQLALDLPAMAKGYYKGVIKPYPSAVLSSYFSKSMPGWGFPYEQWPQDLKDEYAYNPAEARRLLAEAGFPHGFKTNIVVDTGTDPGVFEIVRESFAQIGIEMEVRPMETNACTAFIEAGKYDQLVYREYGPFGHCYAPFMAVNRFNSTNNFMMVNDPYIDSLFPKAIAATSEAELQKLTRDMNEYVARHHFAISLLTAPEYGLCQPWLKGYHGQIHSVWMGMGGPSRLSFYGARFWIDRKLKKSMGKE